MPGSHRWLLSTVKQRLTTVALYVLGLWVCSRLKPSQVSGLQGPCSTRAPWLGAIS